MQPMTLRHHLTLGSFAVLATASVIVFSAPAVHAQEAQFFIDPSLDVSGRTSVTATFVHESNRMQAYVENDYWNTRSTTQRDAALAALWELGTIFDGRIYGSVTRAFGSPPMPGIDGEPKITVLFTRTNSFAAGYFRSDDQHHRAAVSDSNERDMFYVGTNFITSVRLKEIAAHEFQHLINYHQKTRRTGLLEEVWLNEMLSEVAPTIAGLTEDNFTSSNSYARGQLFFDSPTESVLDWHNTSFDYATAHMFGHYLYGQFGTEVFTRIVQSNHRGIPALNDALAAMQMGFTFETVFADWSITNLLNDCSVPPVGRYCYRNTRFADDGEYRIQFNTTQSSGDSISSTEEVELGSAGWFKYSRDKRNELPEDHIFIYEFSTAHTEDFTVPFLLFSEDGTPHILSMQVRSGIGAFSFEGFGFEITEVVVIPVNPFTTTIGSDIRFVQEARVATEPSPSIPLINVSGHVSADQPEQPTLSEGALVRAEGDTRVYVIKGGYKRWIPSPDIMDMYGHLRWEDIQIVSAAALAAHEESRLVREEGDVRVYLVHENGSKEWITSEADFLSRGFSFGMVYIINERELNWYAVQ